ncbi:hypothetical protein BH10PSE12_BH10PSE12_01660 [soil metagenome]
MERFESIFCNCEFGLLCMMSACSGAIALGTILLLT